MLKISDEAAPVEGAGAGAYTLESALKDVEVGHGGDSSAANSPRYSSRCRCCCYRAAAAAAAAIAIAHRVLAASDLRVTCARRALDGSSPRGEREPACATLRL